MSFLKSLHTEHHQPIMFILMVLALAGVLFFGLRPKGYDFSNKASLLKGRGGLQFEKYSVAYTPPLAADIARQLASLERFTLFLNFNPRPDFNDGFGLILVMHAGDDDDQLVIGQWRSHIIAMNGDDYAHKRRLPRISFDILETSRIVQSGIDQSEIGKSKIAKLGSGIKVVLTSGENGTRVYVNGKLVKEKPHMMLKVPKDEGVRLILGNSPYGSASWQGDIYNLALYAGLISEKAVAGSISSEAGKNHPEKLATINPLFSYDFEAVNGKRVMDRSGNGLDLHIPDSVVPLKRKILAWPWHDVKANRGFFLDVVVNFLGFVPLGFLFSAVLTSSEPLSIRPAILVTVLCCFLLSLGIEIAQAWLPSRSSSMLDLVMNTVGALAGASLLKIKGITL